MCLQGQSDPRAALASAAQTLITADKGVFVCRVRTGKQRHLLEWMSMVMKPQPKLICVRVWISVLCKIRSVTLREVSAVVQSWSTLLSSACCNCSVVITGVENERERATCECQVSVLSLFVYRICGVSGDSEGYSAAGNAAAADSETSCV